LCGGGCRIERDARDGVRTAETEGGLSCSSGGCGNGNGRSGSEQRLSGFIPLNVISS